MYMIRTFKLVLDEYPMLTANLFAKDIRSERP
jgi:hypothetical protein